MKNYIIIITVLIGFSSCSLVPLQFQESSTEFSTVFEQSFSDEFSKQKVTSESEIINSNELNKKSPKKTKRTVTIVLVTVLVVVAGFGVIAYNAMRNSQ